MKLTSLNLRDAQDPPRQQAPAGECPSCGGKERVDGCGFGRHREVLCARCGYEFKGVER